MAACQLPLTGYHVQWTVKPRTQKHIVPGSLDGSLLLTHSPWKHGLQVASLLEGMFHFLVLV